MLNYIIPFIVLILVVVFIHEYGHYYFAKKYGVGVTDFSIGFGKELFGFNDKSGTRWKFCAIPLGGYVKFFGDRNVFSQAEQEELLKQYSREDQRKLFVTKPIYQRALVVAAGPLANFFLAIVIFTFIFMFNGKDFTPHLKWNLNTDDKPFWLKKYNEMHVPKGYPIFEFKKSLELNQVFYPNYKFINDCVLEVKNNGYDKLQLLSIYNLYKNQNNLGQFETKIQSKNRLYKELLETRDYIENLTGKDSSYIVFPGGGVNKEVRQFLKDNKFKLITKGNQLNGFNTKLFQVSRLAGFVDLKLGGVINSLANIPLLYLQILRGQGKYFLNKLIKR